MPPRKPAHETHPQGTRSFSELCGQAPCRSVGPGPTRSSSPPRPRQNCWDIPHGCTSTTLSGHPQVTDGPPRWWDPPKSAWLGLLLIFLLSPPTQAIECECMRSTSRHSKYLPQLASRSTTYFSSYTHKPATCYSGKTPTTCTSKHAPGRTFWTSELSQTSRPPCTQYPKTGKVCWTYLGHAGLTDGGGVQDQAAREVTRRKVIQLNNRLQASTQLTYKGTSLDSIKRSPPPNN